jgi:hypothetical protein
MVATKLVVIGVAVVGTIVITGCTARSTTSPVAAPTMFGGAEAARRIR